MSKGILSYLELNPLPTGTVEGIPGGAFNDELRACNEWLERRGIRYESLAQMNFAQRRSRANRERAKAGKECA